MSRDKLTVEVNFGGGDIRSVPAHYEEDMRQNMSRYFGDGTGMSMQARLVPNPLPGIRFVETLAGWHAYRERN